MGECARTLDVCLHDDVTACVPAYEPAIVLLKCAEMPPLVLPFGKYYGCKHLRRRDSGGTAVTDVPERRAFIGGNKR